MLRQIVLSCLLALWSLSSFGPDNEFYRRLVQARGDLPQPTAFAFLDDLEEMDYRVLREALFRRDFASWYQLRAHNFRGTFERYTHLIGILGELCANVEMRRALPSRPGTIFVDSSRYDLENPDGTRPDGLMVRPLGGKILVEDILESKMGIAKYAGAQTYGFLRVWQLVGLSLPDGTHYEPQNILLLVDGRHVELHRLNLRDPNDFATAERAVLLYATRTHEDFSGRTRLVPFTAAEMVEVSKRFAAYSWLGDRANRERVDRVLERERPLPRGFIPRRKIVEPKIGTGRAGSLPAEIPEHILYPERFDPRALPEWDGLHSGPVPEALHTPQEREPRRPKRPIADDTVNDNTLVHYIGQHGCFPTATTHPQLAKYLNQVGGRMTVFSELLDNATRDKLAATGNLPAIGPYENWLAKTSLEEQGAEHVQHLLALYVQAYGKKAGVAEKFFAGLALRSPEWQALLAANPIESLRELPCRTHLEKLGENPIN